MQCDRWLLFLKQGGNSSIGKMFAPHASERNQVGQNGTEPDHRWQALATHTHIFEHSAPQGASQALQTKGERKSTHSPNHQLSRFAGRASRWVCFVVLCWSRCTDTESIECNANLWNISPKKLLSHQCADVAQKKPLASPSKRTTKTLKFKAFSAR